VTGDLAELARKNQILGSLSRATLQKMLADMVCRSLRVRDCVVRRNEPIQEVFFPVDCVLSTLAQGAGGDMVEVATVGNEGLAGISVFLGVNSSSTLETFAQISGDALVIRSGDFRSHIDASARLREVLGSYTQALLAQISQSAACNRLHPAEERMARWLLMTHDRVGADRFDLTQEFMAQMLGVRRATVSEVANELQLQGLIQYSRGAIEIRNRAVLEERSCECYRLIRDEYSRLLPTPG